jgi:hypothetical protein
VGAASLHARALAKAPANVTVIGAAEIRGYGYHTPAEAPASVAGVRNASDKHHEDRIHPDVDRIAGGGWTLLRLACRVRE